VKGEAICVACAQAGVSAGRVTYTYVFNMSTQTNDGSNEVWEGFPQITG
jgi:hypothetical protein